MVNVSAALASAGSLIQCASVRAFTLASALWLSPGEVEQIKVTFPGPDIRPRGLFDTEVVVNRFAHGLHNRRVHSKSFEQSVQSHESHVDDRVCRANVPRVQEVDLHVLLAAKITHRGRQLSR